MSSCHTEKWLCSWVICMTFFLRVSTTLIHHNQNDGLNVLSLDSVSEWANTIPGLVERCAHSRLQFDSLQIFNLINFISRKILICVKNEPTCGIEITWQRLI